MPYRPTIILSLVAWCRVAVNATLLFEPVRFCAAQGEPTSGGKILLEQKQAVQQWDKLLKGLSPKEQVLTLQAINLSILLFNEKGIAALITQYMLKLFELDQQPEAKTAHLVLLALKERDPQNYKVRSSFTWALSLSGKCPGSNPTSGAPLYPEHPSESNSLLLLGRGAQARTSKSVAPAGKATTYPPNSANYDQFKQQGFDRPSPPGCQSTASLPKKKHSSMLG